MSYTNQTPNYGLPQYLANDKPTYLGDFNSAMQKIDEQMKKNNDLAKNASDISGNIGEQITQAQETANNAQTTAETASTTATEAKAATTVNTNNITKNTTAINDLASQFNLKNNIKLTLNQINIQTSTGTRVRPTSTGFHWSVNYNDDKTIGKIYGTIVFPTTAGTEYTCTFASGVSLASAFTVNNMVISIQHTDTTFNDVSMSHLTFNTNGTCSFKVYAGGTQAKVSLLPVLIFLKNFGDVDV